MLNDSEWIELTWKDKVVHILDHDTLQVNRTIDMWPGLATGWGITLDPAKRILYATDGSAKMTTIDADTLEQTGQIDVTWNGNKQDAINELEFVDGYIWANVFYLNGMVKIDPSNGHIVEVVDFEDLHEGEMEMVEEKN